VLTHVLDFIELSEREHIGIFLRSQRDSEHAERELIAVRQALRGMIAQAELQLATPLEHLLVEHAVLIALARRFREVVLQLRLCALDLVESGYELHDIDTGHTLLRDRVATRRQVRSDALRALSTPRKIKPSVRASTVRDEGNSKRAR
jgi:hypothetical protein